MPTPSNRPFDPSSARGEYRPTVGQPKLVQAPRDRREAAQEAALDTLHNLKTMAQDLIDDFKASDRFFKYKASVIAAWLLLSGASLFVACPSTPSAPSNALDARVRVQNVSTLDRQITAIYVENRGKKDWGDILFKLNSTYSAAVPGIAAGGNTVVQLDKFAGSNGNTPPPDMKPQRLEMRCNQGEASFDLTIASPP